MIEVRPRVPVALAALGSRGQGFVVVRYRSVNPTTSPSGFKWQSTRAVRVSGPPRRRYTRVAKSATLPSVSKLEIVPFRRPYGAATLTRASWHLRSTASSRTSGMEPATATGGVSSSAAPIDEPGISAQLDNASATTGVPRHLQTQETPISAYPQSAPSSA